MRSKNLWIFIFSLFLCVNALAQEKVITGKVVDASGYPLADAYVYVEGADKGVYTDAEGNYKISAAVGDKLKFEFIGFDTVTKTITDKSKKVDVKMSSGDKDVKLDEVVTTGITTTDKRLFTGAADRLKGDDIKLDGIPDASRALEGRSAGVSVQNVSGSFGSAPKIRVRGATSIYGSSKPLWVVDGVVLEDPVELSADDLASGDVSTLVSSAIAGLNPNDIESIEVLKDGSATSIYGARAMAGVIVITTKRGKAGVSTFNYTGEFTYRLRPTYKQFNIMNSQQQMSVYLEMLNGGWLEDSSLTYGRETGEFGRLAKLIQFSEIINNDEGKAAYLRPIQYRNTDWFKELFKSNILQSHSVSMSSGTEKATYYASLSALVDPGWTLASNVNRYTANFNTSYKLSDKLTFVALTNGSYRKQKAPGTLSQDYDYVRGTVKRDFDINPYSFALNSSRILDPNAYYTRNYAPFNIKKELEENYIDINVADLKFQSELKWKPLRNVEANVLGAVKYQNTNQEHNITEFSNQAMAYRADKPTTVRDRNPFLYKDPDDPHGNPFTVLPKGGIYEKVGYSMLGYDFRATASYKNEFNNIHTVNVYVGAESNSIDRKRTEFTGWGLQYSMGETPFYVYPLFKKAIEENTLYYGINNTRYRNLAYFANATYSWKRKYTVNGTLRYEGTNKLGKSRSARWLPTWNVSGAWNISKEDFFDPLKNVVSNLTLKASYSLTADRGPAWVTNSLVDIRSYNPWRPVASLKESGLFINGLENSELTYEKKHELNLGLQAEFLKGRIQTSLDWYKRDNYDLITSTITQGLGGVVTKFGNVGAMKSSGVELSINTTNIKTKDFSWVTSFVYSHNENEVTKLEGRVRAMSLLTGNGFAKEGKPVRAIYSIPFKGLNDEGLPLVLNEDGEITDKGVNFQQSDNLDYLIYSGNADPTDVGSFGNIFTYKNFKLNVFLTYSFGNVVRLDPVFSDEYSDLVATPREFENRWVVAGDEKKTNVPVIASIQKQEKYGSHLGRAYNSYNYSDLRIAKGDFVRLKEVSLIYNVNKSFSKRIGLNDLSLKLQGTNLLLLYADGKLNGQDPEFINSGGVASPVPRQITFTLRANL
ncbi:SusC/RagA family TonB-linked outer membrane protein [Ornithobacterium rhinotracheale]|uniref:SusC/RagA family TonB-linked outer membrane protein n=1 Tax=Ornithobacterium rhinotracheale TaxID=28251 RepID=UPI001FF6A1D9|nr:SusC/RagA family TonB-linked outer membrane protein [Ornithobacterium rhinotracheale]MCK0199306.1 SusC/RagA family TonB-linked outer membrane protein [Ornithobacterium rhinotracheale]